MKLINLTCAAYDGEAIEEPLTLVALPASHSRLTLTLSRSQVTCVVKGTDWVTATCLASCGKKKKKQILGGNQTRSKQFASIIFC